jgi:hypothetical protein
VNQRFPSGPATIDRGELAAFGRGNSSIVCARAIAAPASSAAARMAIFPEFGLFCIVRHQACAKQDQRHRGFAGNVEVIVSGKGDSTDD